MKTIIISLILGLFLTSCIQTVEPETDMSYKVVVLKTIPADYKYQYGYVIRSNPNNGIPKYIDGKWMFNYTICEVYSNTKYAVGQDLTNMLDMNDCITNCDCVYME